MYVCLCLSVFHAICNVLVPIFMVLYFKPYFLLFCFSAPHVQNLASLGIVLRFERVKDFFLFFEIGD